MKTKNAASRPIPTAAGHQILGGGGGNMGVKSAARAGHKINGDCCFVHVGIGLPQFFHTLFHQSLIFFACRGKVGRCGIHQSFSVFVFVG